MIAIMFPAHFDQLQHLGPVRHRYAEGASVFHRGDPVRVLHIVMVGEVHLVRYQEHGTALILQRAGPGSALAEASLFSQTYHCDAIAVRASDTLAVPGTALRAQLWNDPEFAQSWAAYLSRAVQVARLRAEILSLRTVSERLDAWLVANNGRIPAKGAWKTVATEIGISAPAFYRELAKRRAAGTL